MVNFWMGGHGLTCLICLSNVGMFVSRLVWSLKVSCVYTMCVVGLYHVCCVYFGNFIDPLKFQLYNLDSRFLA
jgi:hypothetical protein